jgi:hypothetical protein
MSYRSLFWLGFVLTGYCWWWETQTHSAEWVTAAAVGTFMTGAAWGHWREERAFIAASAAAFGDDEPVLAEMVEAARWN